MAEHRWDTAPSTSRLSASVPVSVTPEQELQPAVPAPAEPSGPAGAPGSSPTPRRWMMSFRAAVLAVCLLVGTTAGLAVFKGGGADAEVSSVELAADGSSGGNSASDADAGSDTDTDTDTGAGAEEDGEGGSYGDYSGAGAGRDGVSRPGATGDADRPGAEKPSTASAGLVIHVAGAVGRPGVVRVPSGSRTGDAVDAAGGAAADADLTAVNLAAPLQDGMMVVVPRIGESIENPLPVSAPQTGAETGNGPGPGGAGGPGPNPGPGALININSASLQELDALPRVGPVIAQRIIDWRADHGKFSRPEDLDAVPGIGEAMLAALLPLITV